MTGTAAQTPFHSVAAYAPSYLATFTLGIVSEVFGFDRTGRPVGDRRHSMRDRNGSQPGGGADGPAEGMMPRFDFALCALRPGRLRTDTGLTVVAEYGLDRLAGADLVVVLPWEAFDDDPPAELCEALRAAYDRGAIIASCCTGAFVLAAAGLLDERRATTHWRWADAFRARFPDVKLVADVLYIDEGQILTSAGGAGGIDLCLYLVRREYGASVATAIARDMVVPPHRDGGQAQYVAVPVPADCDDDRLSDVIGWARANLDQRLTVTDLAGRALMSPRSFARHFKAITGTTPHAWLLGQRLHRAEELLETGDLPIEEVARRSGFGTAAALREQFTRRRGVPPRDYRRTFATPPSH